MFFKSMLKSWAGSMMFMTASTAMGDNKSALLEMT